MSCLGRILEHSQELTQGQAPGKVAKIGKSKKDLQVMSSFLEPGKDCLCRCPEHNLEMEHRRANC